MQFLIITGMSGAGKSRAADVLEDLDFYCVDNMPAELMPMFARLCMATKGRYEKVALVTDVREKNGFGELLHILDGFDELEFDYKILYMDADVRTLVRRYKETRRPHPLAQDGESLESSIRREEKLLEPIKKRSDYIIDTGSLTLGMLQNRLYSIFAEDGQKKSVTVNVVSFGYKFGIPTDADLVFDVRFLPNPFYVDDLRTMSGMDEPVKDYIFSSSSAGDFLKMLYEMVDYLLPLYAEEGKLSLNIAVGCTGGRHRSVAVAGALYDHLKKSGAKVTFTNRDMDK
ncbi:MAG: RNase adapter RapZ [Oscillospiraceae bacterium]|nr:RNase adapter RapZ [Oscillospiraceae bacterium]MBQ2146263.1 RNase adapter RapZ [Oscillospiraceae bacterium]MBQ5489789.1 RNase adapter RapZ [Oscillospiraceae bacterium]